MLKKKKGKGMDGHEQITAISITEKRKRKGDGGRR